MRYRYRTPALVGRWCSTREEALLDALKANQARRVDAHEIELMSYTMIEEGDPPAGHFPTWGR